jgi:hypothetical protein
VEVGCQFVEFEGIVQKGITTFQLEVVNLARCVK